MNAEIICIGTELLLGHIVNTNASFLSQALAEGGIDLYTVVTVGDNPGRLADAITQALDRSDVVITSGGLGPTVDDITMGTIARITGRRLRLDKGVFKDLESHFKLRGLKVPSCSMRQAYVPEGATLVRNKVGTAPGLIIRHHEKTIICLPGPPREIEPMFVRDIMPYLKKVMAQTPWVIRSRVIKVAGLAESQVDGKVKDLLRMGPPTTVGIYAKLGEVNLKIMTKAGSERRARREIRRLERIIGARLKDAIFGYDDETLEGAVGRLLTKKALTISVAESCTGGLLSHRLTNVSGSSAYFMAGIVTYSNGSKENFLGVPHTSIERHGAVSEDVALEMAKGIRHYACTDIGIGITGIAGPEGGTKKKPVGLVYIGFFAGKRRFVKECRFRGTREEIKFQATQVALNLIRKHLISAT